MTKNYATQLGSNIIEVGFNALSKYSEYMLEETTSSEKTISNYLQDLKQFEKHLETTGGNLHRLSRIDVQDYINYLVKENRSAATINRHFNSIRSYSKFIEDEDIVRKIRNIPKKQKVSEIAPDTLTDNELKRVLREVDLMAKSGKKIDIKTQAIIVLLAYSGIRVDELCNLNIKDCEFKNNGKMTVNGKGNKTRTISFTVEARDYVGKYLETRDDAKEDNSPLFISKHGNRMERTAIFRFVKKVGERVNAGLKPDEHINLHPHIFRHTFVRILLEKMGYDIALVAQIMGHESIEITRRYATRSLKDIGNDLDNMSLM